MSTAISDFSTSYGHGQLGWGTDDLTVLQRFGMEDLLHEETAGDDLWLPPEAVKLQAERLDKIRERTVEHYPMLDGGLPLWAFGEYGSATPFNPIKMYPQIIGSCVASGGARAFALRMLFEVLARGDLETVMGSELYGDNSFISYAPLNYGEGRKFANIRGGDGSYCEVHVRSLKLGVVDCNDSRLDRYADHPRDLPEPQDTRTYRDFGNWQHLNDFPPATRQAKLTSAERITDVDRLWKVQTEMFAPCMVCSNQGFGPKRHLDSLGITEYGFQGNWAHNMTIGGGLSLNGNRFFEVDNSWGMNAHRPVPGLGGGPSFFISYETMKRWLNNAVVIALLEIDLADSVPSAS